LTEALLKRYAFLISFTETDAKRQRLPESARPMHGTGRQMADPVGRGAGDAPIDVE